MNFAYLCETFTADRGRPSTDTPRFQRVSTILCSKMLWGAYFYSNGYKQGFKQLPFLLESTKPIVRRNSCTMLTDNPSDTNRYCTQFCTFLHLARLCPYTTTTRTPTAIATAPISLAAPTAPASPTAPAAPTPPPATLLVLVVAIPLPLPLPLRLRLRLQQ